MQQAIRTGTKQVVSSRKNAGLKAMPARSARVNRASRGMALVRASYEPVGTPIQGSPQYSQPTTPPSVFTNIERVIQNTFNSQAPGHRNDWREIDGAWVLFPPNNNAPEAVVHFLGGAFVGAAPQISYRLFLEALANRNILVIATPYQTNFDHLRIADEAQFKFDRALRALGPEIGLLPVYGVGHSLGAVVHTLICSRYSVVRAGNAFLSFNNRPATDVIPFLAPIIAPSARLLGPLLQQLAASPVRSTFEMVVETLRGLSPSVVRQVVPLVEQLAPMYFDMGQGREEFTPTAEETRSLIRSYYTVRRNLLLRFRDDTIDESNAFATMLQNTPTISEMLDLSVRTLPGDHLRPLHQAFVDLPPDVARIANQAVYFSGDAIGRLAGMATQMGVSQASGPLSELSKGVVNMAGFFGGEVGGPLTDSMQSLADEVAAWVGTGQAVISGGRALPARSVFSDRPQFGGSPANLATPPPTTF